MEPADPIIDLDTGEPLAPGTGTARGTPAHPAEPAGARSPFTVLAVIVAVVAAASLVFSFVGGSDRTAEQALPQLTPEPTPTPPATGEAAAEADIAIDGSGRGITRAGETCFAWPQDPASSIEAVVRFVVPDGLSSFACRSFGTDPMAAQAGDQLDLRLELQDADLNSVFLRSSAPEPADHATWHPIDGRRGWRFDYDQPAYIDQRSRWAASVVAAEVPGGVLTASASFDRDGPLTRGESLRAFDQLVASIHIEVLEPDPFHYYRDPGGWCGGDDYVTRVPEGWFSNPNCRWLNTSSESPIVLQCNCLPPLFVQRLTIPFDGDFGFTTITSDVIETRSDGTPVRVVEGLRPDPANQERPLLAMIVDGGDSRVAVVASRFTEHALPGHTYDRTLAAQEFLVDNLRFHSGTDCGQGQRWVADSDTGRVSIRLGGDETIDVPSGTALVGTGCTQRDAGELEVAVEAVPNLIGWIDAALVRSPAITLCPSAEGVFDPTRWDETAVGDFDGDGRQDTVYTRRLGVGAPDFGELPTAAVLFANGGLAEGRVRQAPLSGGTVTARRVPGVGHDLLEIRTVGGARDAYELVDVSECSFDIAGWATLRNDVEAEADVCEVTTEVGPALRIWAASVDPYVGLVAEADELWTGLDGRLIFARAPWGSADPPCGPRLPGRPLAAPAGGPGTGLAGSHGLSLRWAAMRDGSVGTIDFAALGDDRYKVTGSHAASTGERLQLIGVVEVVDDDTLGFDGTITTVVADLNRGEPCVRRAGQRFERLAASSIYRLQDRINCDGVATDWIDIILPSAESD